MSGTEPGGQQRGNHEIRWVRDGVPMFALGEGAGPVLVFLHGGLADHRAVRPIVGPLADTYRVITPDLRASGRSWFPGPLTFDQLADDLEALLDHVGADRAFIGGISSGTGPAVRFALRHPERTRALILVQPLYGGGAVGYTEEQAAALSGMNAVARRATTEGVEVLRALYARLPDEIGERAWRFASEFDAASVVATSGFIAAGVQPFDSAGALEALEVPTLLVCGDDPMHPSVVSDVYARSIEGCRVVPATPEPTPAIRAFCDAVVGAGA